VPTLTRFSFLDPIGSSDDPFQSKKKTFLGLPHQSGQTSGANVLLGKLFLHAVVDLQCNAIAMRAEEFAFGW